MPADRIIRCPPKRLLFNFGKKPDFKRAIFSNERREISETEASNPCESVQLTKEGHAKHALYRVN
jgi:hypothetical protein